MTSTAVEVKLGVDALPFSSDKDTWSNDQTALMESLGLKGVKNRKRGNEWIEEEFEAPPAVVQAFLHQARTRGLDPFARQIYCIERGGKWGIEASIDGFRLQAERTRKYLGQTEAQWTDGTQTQVPLFHDGQLVMVNGQPLTKLEYVWVDAWVSSKPPAAARVGVLRDGFAEPIWGVATYAGYCPRDRDGNYKPTGQWQFNAANQLAKCAEMLGLRKTFPTELSGLYGAEEMDQAGSSVGQRPTASAPIQGVIPTPEQAPIAAPVASRDWGKQIADAETLEATSALYREAEAAGELGIAVGHLGDKDDGTAHTVMDLFWMRKRELEQQTPPMVDVPPKKTGQRRWVHEARSKTTRTQVQALHREAIAAGAPVQVIDEIEAIVNTLPDPDAVKPETSEGWAVAQIPTSGTEWVEDENGEYREVVPPVEDVPGVLDASIGGES